VFQIIQSRALQKCGATHISDSVNAYGGLGRSFVVG
jgi:hypothetical protein